MTFKLWLILRNALLKDCNIRNGKINFDHFSDKASSKRDKQEGGLWATSLTRETIDIIKSVL